MVRGLATTLIAAAVLVPTLGGSAEARFWGEPTAIVSIGDSYISGEGARWMGNSMDELGDRKGTDRAHRGPFDFDIDSIYVDGTNESGCHRADAAPIEVVELDVDRRINLACSGAHTTHVIGAANGGQVYRGERPQADQLAWVAAVNSIEMVVVSIGGNDLGFDDMILDCTIDYTTSLLWWENKCADDQQANVDQTMDEAMVGVVAALADVREALDRGGDEDARIVLVSYPSPVPSGDELRHRTSLSRTFLGGCPLWGSDATWARDSLVPQIASELRAAAAVAGVEFLDLQDLFEGREVCSRTAGQSDGSPSDVTDEWARFLTIGILQGEAQESLHPNYFGQQAIGRCIELVGEAEPGGEWTCTNRPGGGARDLDLTRL